MESLLFLRKRVPHLVLNFLQHVGSLAAQEALVDHSSASAKGVLSRVHQQQNSVHLLRVDLEPLPVSIVDLRHDVEALH